MVEPSTDKTHHVEGETDAEWVAAEAFDLAYEVAALTAERDRLREALRRIAAEDHRLNWTLGDIARAALTQEQP